MKPFLRIFLFLIFSSYAFAQVNIIPKPHSVFPQRGTCIIKGKLNVVYQHADSLLILPALKALTSSLRPKLNCLLHPGLKLNIAALPSPVPYLIFEKTKKDFFRDEGYSLSIQPKLIRIEAKDASGFFYAIQSLLQLMPAEFLNPEMPEWSILEIPCMDIEDFPRFSYRGMHLDVARHFFSVSDIKKYLDLMAMHKMNRFHWHLTDDQGWRIEIKKYPRLTEVGAKRKETMKGHYDEQQWDGKPYSGYYSQDEIKEVVDYARQLCIEVIPEIEMPGHALAALASYPELSCTGGPFETATSWGVFDDVFCTKEPVFKFLEDVLEEVCMLFPGKYIHIGGDECPKTRWKACSLCQTRIRTEGLKDEHELQSWFIKRINQFIESKGKQIIGWDEILEGGLAPGATVMSWRGTEGGIAAARLNHDVIMSPASHCYFDHYQAEPDVSPLAIGGFTPIEKVYAFEPVPFDSLSDEQQKHILGAQGNVWTEYLPLFSLVEYMAYPRACALAEVVWSDKSSRNWNDFSSRLIRHLQKLMLKQVNFSTDIFNVTSRVFRENDSGKLFISLHKLIDNGSIHYTTDGSEPDNNSPVFKEPLPLCQQLNAKLISDFGSGKTLSKTFLVHKANGMNYKLAYPWKQYHGGTDFGLTDGLPGKINQYNTWVGFSGDDMEAVLDLKEVTEIKKVSVNFYNKNRSCIFLPQYVEIFTSDDGMDFFSVARQDVISDDAPNSIINSTFLLPAQNVRYLKVFAKNTGVCPSGSICEGQKAWLFADEILIE